MLVSLKDGAKLAGVFLVVCCAALICTMFLSFYLDVLAIHGAIVTEGAEAFYQAQVSTAKVVIFVAGGCLLVTSLVMLLFYIRHYIDVHKKELGILKAMGCGAWKIAGHFWVFGCSVFFGGAAGFAGAHLLIPQFYRLQNKDHILPEIVFHFRPLLFVYLAAIPAALFAFGSVCYARRKLQSSALSLLREQELAVGKRPRQVGKKSRIFLADLQKSTVQSKKILVFFVWFAAFCFASMTQMAFSMKDLASEMMGVMILLIGMLLACTTLLLAVTTVVRGNAKTIAMMRAFGYSDRQCSQGLLGGYRWIGYFGFLLGTAYQYGLLKLMVYVVFREISTPDYGFDLPNCLLSLAAYAVFYEGAMYVYARRMKKLSVKEIMLT